MKIPRLIQSSDLKTVFNGLFNDLAIEKKQFYGCRLQGMMYIRKQTV